MQNSFAVLAILFSSTSLAAPTSLSDCLTSQAVHLASLPPCATDRSLLVHCLSNLEIPASQEDISSCHISAGCDPSDSSAAAEHALSHCHDIVSGADLRRRAGEDLGYMPILGRQADQTGNECLETFTVDTTACDLATKDGRVSTVTCSPTQAARSTCKAGKTCGFDRSNGNDICMDLKDDLDVAGIVIAIIFASAIVLGIGTLTWLCCKDRKEQKRLQAKAEATALARAATKKKRAQDVRQPLMAQHEQPSYAPGPDVTALGGGIGGGNGADPFHDGQRL